MNEFNNIPAIRKTDSAKLSQSNNQMKYKLPDIIIEQIIKVLCCKKNSDI